MKKSDQMKAVVIAYHQSPMDQKQFAASNEISVYKLKYWIQKFQAAKQERGSFITLDSKSVKSEAMELEICYPNGISIKATDIAPAFLIQLIKLY